MQRLDKLLKVMPRGGVPVLVLLCHDKCNSRLVSEIELRLSLRHIDRDSVKVQELCFDVDDPVNQIKVCILIQLIQYEKLFLILRCSLKELRVILIVGSCRVG